MLILISGHGKCTNVIVFKAIKCLVRDYLIKGVCYLYLLVKYKNFKLVVLVSRKRFERLTRKIVHEWVKLMKRYGNIYDKICDMENLKLAHASARKDKLYYREVKMVDENPEKYLRKIQVILQNKTYKITAKDYIVSTINDKGKERNYGSFHIIRIE